MYRVGRDVFYLGLLLAFTEARGFGQEKLASVEIGGHEVRLGMPVQELVANLSAENFQVQPEAVDSKLPLRAWNVWGPPAGAWAYTFAVIYTKGDTIAGVVLRTTNAGGTLQDVFNALFGAASKVYRQHWNPCSIAPLSTNLSNGNVVNVQLDCSGLRINVVRTEFTDAAGNRREDYEVSESVGTVRAASNKP